MFGDFFNLEDDESKKDNKVSKLMKYLSDLSKIDMNREPDEVKITVKNGIKKTISIWKDGESEVTAIDIERIDEEDELDNVEIPEEEMRRLHLEKLYAKLNAHINSEQYEKAGEIYNKIKVIQKAEAKRVREESKNKMKKD